MKPKYYRFKNEYLKDLETEIYKGKKKPKKRLHTPKDYVPAVEDWYPDWGIELAKKRVRKRKHA